MVTCILWTQTQWNHRVHRWCLLMVTSRMREQVIFNTNFFPTRFTLESSNTNRPNLFKFAPWSTQNNIKATKQKSVWVHMENTTITKGMAYCISTHGKHEQKYGLQTKLVSLMYSASYWTKYIAWLMCFIRGFVFFLNLIQKSHKPASVI